MSLSFLAVKIKSEIEFVTRFTAPMEAVQKNPFNW